MSVDLTRQLVLETPQQTADGSGGQSVGWQGLGSLWASVDARSGREAPVGARDLSKVRYRIVVRGAPEGSPQRPHANQRFREGTRVFTILAVAEADPLGKWLECWAEEGRI